MNQKLDASLKMGKIVILQERKQMPKKYVKRCSTSLEMREVEVKSTVRISVREECGADGNVSRTSILANSLM